MLSLLRLSVLLSLFLWPCNGFAQSSAVTQAPLGTVVWIGHLSNQDRSRWEEEKFLVRHDECAPSDVECVSDLLMNIDTPDAPLLVLRGDYDQTLGQLLSRNRKDTPVSAIVTFGSESAHIPAAIDPSASKLVHLVEQTDPGAYILEARKRVSAARSATGDATLVFLENGQITGPDIGDVAFETLLYFAGYAPYSEQMLALLTAQTVWPHLPPNNKKLLADPAYIKQGTALHNVKSMFRFHYRYEPWQLKQWEFKSYTAFDLYAYRDHMAPGARYAILKNRLGQVFFMDLDTYAPFGPEIVVGLDDQSNMYHFVWFYQTKLMYSWRDEVQNLSAQPLGPFLSFKTAPPPELAVPPLMTSLLHLGGISFSREDPLSRLAPYPEPIRNVLKSEGKCIYCHQVDGFGGRAYHLDALTAQGQGGFALPLAEYSEDVMREFLYNQEAVAKKVGLTPNPVHPDVVDEFFELVKGLSTQAAPKAD